MSEIIDLEDGTMPWQNRIIRDGVSSSVDGLGLNGSSQPVEDVKKSFNAFNMSSDCPPMVLTKPYTLVSGNATVVEAEKTSLIEEDSMFHGISFFAVEAKPDEAAIKVSTDKRAVFIGCTFADPTLKRFQSSNTKEIITVEDGGQAIFIGCLFVGVAVGVKNEGGAPDAGNVILIGCSKRFTGAFGTDVTEVSSLG